ncbi:MAG: hypothetical protein JWM44_2977 [Bacilli bacterium]|nr:hypothetical protein [Bacilli bacterium]
MFNYLKFLYNTKPTYLVVFIFLVLPLFFYFNFLYSDGLLAPGDGTASYAPAKHFLMNSISQFNFPLWNSGINLGTPFYADIQNACFYLPNLLLSILPFNMAYNYLLLFHLSLAGIFTYLYLFQIKLDKKSAFLGGLVFMFCGTINAKFGHVTVQNAIIWLPLILYFYEKLLDTGNKKYVVLMSFAFSMQIFAGFIQVSFYSAIILFIYYLTSVNKYKKFKYWLLDLVNFSVITIGLTAIQIVPMISLAKSVDRTAINYEFFSSFSLPFQSIATLIFPNIFGVHVPDSPFKLYHFNYFNVGNLTEFAMYIGILPLIFAINIVLRYFVHDRFVRVWCLILFVSFILALGDSLPFLNRLMFEVPVFNAFRVSARFLFVFNLAIAVLFAKQYDLIIKDKKPSNVIKKLLKTSILISAISALSVIIIVKVIGLIVDHMPPGIAQNTLIKTVLLQTVRDNFDFKNPAIFIPIGLILLSNIYLLIFWKNRVKYIQKILYIVLVLLLLLDLHTFDFYHEKIFTKTDTSNKLVEKIKSNIKYDERIWPIFDNDTAALELSPNKNMNYGINSINGYVTFLPQMYKNTLKFDERGYNSNYVELLFNNEIISTFNTKYIIVGNKKTNIIDSLNTIDKKNPVNIGEMKNLNLSSPNEKDVSIVQEDVNIKADSFYKISLKLKKAIKGALQIDLYGENYDSPFQELDILPEGNSLEYSKYIYSDNLIPKDVKFRVFTFSKEPILIDEVKLDLIPKKESKNNDSTIYQKVYNDESYTVYENKNVLPKIFSINNIVTNNNNKTDYSKMFQMDLHNSAIIDNYTADTKTFKKADLKLLSYKDGYMKAQSQSSEQSFVVFSESYYPGWKVYINGKKSVLYKVNGLLQGVKLPAGNNTVEFKFNPESVYINLLILVLTLIYIYIYLSYRNKKQLILKIWRR